MAQPERREAEVVLALQEIPGVLVSRLQH